MTSIPCPKCGQSASGQFCSNCGASLVAPTCRSCSTQLSPGATFCHQCGAQQTQLASGSNLKWLALIPVAAVMLALGWFAARQPGAPPPADQPAAGLAAAPNQIDISELPPVEQANRMFNVVMAAKEGGDQEGVSLHAPIAIQAYLGLGALDRDGHFHLGMLYTANGEFAQALDRADSLSTAVPGHLLASMLRAAVAESQSDSTALRDSYDEFLANYEAEIVISRDEYVQHAGTLEGFRERARQAQ